VRGIAVELGCEGVAASDRDGSVAKSLRGSSLHMQLVQGTARERERCVAANV